MKPYLLICLLLMIGITIASAQQGAEDWYQKGVDASTSTQKINYFTKAIRLNANYLEAYNARANVYFVNGKVSEAIEDFSQAIRIDPSRAFTFYSRASCQLALNNYEAAAADFDKVIQLEPNQVYAMSGKGCALMLEGKNEDALAILNQALTLDESVQSAIRCRDQALKKLGKQPLAVPVANKSNPPASAQPIDLESSTHFILKEATSLRKEPTHTSPVLLRFETGDQVELLEKTDEFWWKVRYKGKTGFAKAALLEAMK